MRKILIVLFLSFVPVSALADDLVLVKGKGFPVCEAHFMNLKELSLFRMVCERDEYYPEQNGITRSEWEELDLKENKELYRKMKKFFTYGDQHKRNKDLDDEKKFEKLKPPTTGVLNIANMDIGNNGKNEMVALYSQGRCMESSYYARPLAVVDGYNKQVDIEKTSPLLQNISQPGYDMKSEARESMYRLYDVFFYKNGTYFDKWFIYDWTLTVYKLSKDGVEEVCKFKYKKNALKKEE